MHFGKFIPKYITKIEEIEVDVLENSWIWSKIKIWTKAVRIFDIRAHDAKEGLRHIVVPYNICNFFKENHAIDQGERTGTIIGTEPDNEMKYREEIENAYNELAHWKRNLFSLLKRTPGKAFISEVTKLMNEIFVLKL